MPLTREQICQSAARKLRGAIADLPSRRVMVGFDGFVDEIIAVVDVRYPDGTFAPVRTITQFAEKIAAAADKSSNYELVVKQIKLGGNGPIMANALATAGLRVSYIGGVGYPTLHPVFNELAQKANVLGIAEPGHTDALEFDDGKLMLGKHGSLEDIHWQNLLARVGERQFVELIDGADLVALVNWTMLPRMSAIWQEMLTRGIPSRRPNRRMFIDLADPEKRTPSDLVAALQLVTRFGQQVDVTLGLNLKESLEVGGALEVTPPADPEADVGQWAAAIRQRLNLACVVVHPRRSAAAATADQVATFPGPYIGQPRISTGAGDHFNAGFCLGQMLGMDLAESLCAGVAASGYYVRSAATPTADELAKFIAELPPPGAG